MTPTTKAGRALLAEKHWNLHAPLRGCAEPCSEAERILAIEAEARQQERDRLAATPSGGGDVERLRKQNKEAAERHDREKAALQSKVDRYEAAFARAKELVRGSPVDWTVGWRANGDENVWWTHTSPQNRNVIAAAILAATTAPALGVGRLARAMYDADSTPADDPWGVLVRHEVREMYRRRAAAIARAYEEAEE